jgi:hypothetical protein
VGGTEGKEGFNVLYKDPFVLTGKSRYEVCGKGAGKQGGNQREAFRKEAPSPYPVNQAAGKIVKGLDPQAHAAYPALPADGKESFVRRFGVCFHRDFFRPGRKNGPETGEEPLHTGRAQNGGSAAPQIQGGNPVHGKTGQVIPYIRKKDAGKGVKPVFVRTDRDGIKVAVIAGAGAEGDVEV